MLVEFSLKLLYIPPYVGKIFKFMVFTFLENVLNLGIFTHVAPYSKLSPKFLSSHPRQKEIIHSPRQFPPTPERGRGKYDLYIKLQSENMKMTWDIRLIIFCMIFIFFKCNGLAVLEIISIIQYGINFIASP